MDGVSKYDWSVHRANSSPRGRHVIWSERYVDPEVKINFYYQPIYYNRKLITSGERDRDYYLHNSDLVGSRDHVLLLLWVEHIYNPMASEDLRTLKETTRYFYFTVKHLGADSVDLRQFVNRDVNFIHLATILRATYGWSCRPSGWSDALNYMKFRLSSDVQFCDELLWGIDD